MDDEMRNELAFVEKLAAEGASLFSLENEADITSLNEAIWRAHEEYICELINKRSTKPVKEQKKALKDLANTLNKLNGILNVLGTEYIFRLDQDAKKRGVGDQINFETLKSVSGTAETLIRDFLDSFSPPKGRSVNWALEHAVRILMPVVETLANCEADIKWNKNTDEAPEPGSRSAEFMVHVISQFQGTPTQTAILNMIAKVKENPYPGKSHFDAVVEDKDELYDLYGNPKSESWKTKQ